MPSRPNHLVHSMHRSGRQDLATDLRAKFLRRSAALKRQAPKTLPRSPGLAIDDGNLVSCDGRDSHHIITIDIKTNSNRAPAKNINSHPFPRPQIRQPTLPALSVSPRIKSQGRGVMRPSHHDHHD